MPVFSHSLAPYPPSVFGLRIGGVGWMPVVHPTVGHDDGAATSGQRIVDLFLPRGACLLIFPLRSAVCDKFIPNCGGAACRLACCSVVRLSQGQRLCWYVHGSSADCLR